MQLYKIKKYLFSFFLFLLLILVSRSEVEAQSCFVTPNPISAGDSEVIFTMSDVYSATYPFSNIQKVSVCCTGHNLCPSLINPSIPVPFSDLGGGNIQITVNKYIDPRAPCWYIPTVLNRPFITLYVHGQSDIRCSRRVNVVKARLQQSCRIQTNPNPPQGDEPYEVIISDLPTGSNVTELGLWWNIDDPDDLGWEFIEPIEIGKSTDTINMDGDPGGRIINLCVKAVVDGYAYDCAHDNAPCSAYNILIGGPSMPDDDKTGELGFTDICSFINNSAARGDCTQCFKQHQVYTPFGCIKTDIQGFIEQMLKIAISLAGGIAFIMIILGGFTVLTSAGNPERLTSGKEIITSAIAGLLLIVFSVVILKIIGVDILAIPGLSK